MKIDNYGDDKMQMLLNCTKEDVAVSVTGEILFEHGYADGILKKDGVLIARI